MAWREWIRTVEVEPSLYGADFAILGEQIETLLRADCRVFHFDVGDGHFVEPITMGPIVLAVDLAADPPLRGRDRRAPDGREPGQVLRVDRGSGRRQRHVPLRGGRRRRRDDPRRARARAAGRGRVQPGDRAGAVAAVRATPTSCSAWRSIPATRASRSGPRRTTGCAACGMRSATPSRSRSTAASPTTTSGSSATAVQRCSSPGRRSSSSRISRAPTAGWSPQLA